MRSKQLLIAAAVALALTAVAIAAVASRTTAGDGAFDISLADVATSARVRPADVSCPTSGRATTEDAPLVGAAFSPPDGRTLSALVAPGQLVAFELLVAPPQRVAGGAIDLTAEWVRGPTGGPGFDAGATACAFVDVTDPVTHDGGAAASVAWHERPVAGERLTVDLAVQGADPADELVIEIWLTVRAAVAQADVPLAVSLRQAEAEAESDADARPEDELRYRLGNFDRAERPVLELAVTDAAPSGPAADQSITYTWTLHNPRRTALVPAARLDVALDPTTTLRSDVVVRDAEGAPTTCEPIGSGFRCDPHFVGPDERITLEATVSVAASAERRNTREEPGCVGEPVDVCARSVLSWAASADGHDATRVEQPTDLPSPDDLAIAAYVDGGAPYAYPGRPVSFTYAVSATSSSFEDVTVTDSRCRGAAYRDGDTDADDELDPAETWRYGCTVSALSDADTAGTARVDAIRDDGAAQTATTTNRLTFIRPAMQLQVDAGGSDGRAVQLRLANVGDSQLSEAAVTASNCAGTAFDGRDAGDDTVIGPGESWTYTCTLEDPARPLAARAYALDLLGQPLSAVPVPP